MWVGEGAARGQLAAAVAASCMHRSLVIACVLFAACLAAGDPYDTKKARVVSSQTLEDHEAGSGPLVLALPPELEHLSGDQCYDYGESFLLQGRTLEAATLLARAAELLPNDSFAHGNLAIALHQMGRSREATPHFRAAASLAPAALYFANLGQALWSIGEIDEAVRVLRTAVRLNPEHVESMARLMQAALPLFPSLSPYPPE